MTHLFLQISNGVTVLDRFQNGQNLTKFCVHNNIDNIYVSIVTPPFSKISNRVMALF